MQEEVKQEYKIDWDYSKPAANELESTRRLAKMVKAHLFNYGLTHAEFCKASGNVITHNQLQPLLCGERKTMSVWMVAAVAFAMHLPVQVLLARCGLFYTPTNVPYSQPIEQHYIAYYKALDQLPEAGRAELAARSIILADEVLEKFGKSPNKA